MPFVKKAIAAVLSVLLLISLFSSCGGEAQKELPEGQDATTIQWYGIGGALPDNFQEGVDAINEYLREKIGVELQWHIVGWNDYQTEFQTMVNSGDTFDIMFASNSYYTRFVNQGAFMDITELVGQVTPDLYSFVPGILWEGARIDGKIYGVPTYKDSSLTQFWYFDHELVEKYDIDVASVHTMDDLDPIFRKVKAGEGEDFYPVYLTRGNPWNGILNQYDNLCTGLEAIGVRLDDESRTVVSVLEQEDFLHKLELLHSWYEDGIINPDANTSQETYRGQFFGSGQGWPAAAIGWATGNGVEQYDITAPIDGPFYTSSTVQGSMNCISASSSHPEEALRFLELANTDTTLRDMLAYGREGTHFEYIEVADERTGETETRVHLLRDDWVNGSAKYSQASFFSLTLMDNEPSTQWEEILDQNEKAMEGVCMGFSMDMTSVEMETAACVQIWENYKPDMQTGAVDPAVLVPQCLAELEAAGLQTIIQEAQKQIDEFFQN